jgi:hypothetical protein
MTSLPRFLRRLRKPKTDALRSSTVVASSALVVALGGCASDAPASSKECDLDASAALSATEAQLDKNYSSSECPTVTPAALNGILSDAGTQGCTLALRGCALRVDCDLGFARGGGRLPYEQGAFRGELTVDQPIECLYRVVVEPR